MDIQNKNYIFLHRLGQAAASMHNKIPGSKLYFIENTGHEVNVKAPEELASLIKKFWINNSKL